MTDLLSATEPEAPREPAPPIGGAEERPVFAPDDAPRREVRPSQEVWHRDAARESAPPRVRLFTMLLAFLAAGVVLGLVTLPRAAVWPLFVSVAVGEYEDSAWPVNSWANQDADRLAERFGSTAVKAFGFQSRDKLRQLLGWLAGESRIAGLPPLDRRRPLVLHLSALGAVRGRAVYLVPADATPDNPDSWINVVDVLKAAADHRNPRTLLILDIARPAADHFSGNLGDDISAALHDVLTAFAPPFPVFAACGPGETAFMIDPAESSAFAFYLAVGLGGAADGFEDPSGPDGEVSVRELVRFTAVRVESWARRTHGRRQTPAVYGREGRATGFVLVRKPEWTPPEPGSPPAYPDWLRAAGAERDVLRTSDAVRRDPIGFARLTAGFRGAEERWWWPGNATRGEDVWRLTRADWMRAAARYPQATDWTKWPTVADRYAVARIGLPEAPPDVQKALTALLVAKPEQEAEAATAWKAAAAPHRVAAVGLVWSLAVDTAAPTADMVARWTRAVEAVDPVKPIAETRILCEVGARESFRRQRLSSYPSAGVAALFRAEDEFARLAALGPDLFKTVAALAARALGEHRAAATALLSASTAEQVQVASAGLSRVAEEYARLRDQLGRARDARNALDTAALVLGETLTGMNDNDRPPSTAWFAVADAATRVADGGSDVRSLVEATEQLVAGYDPHLVLRDTAPDRRVDPRGAAQLRALLTGAALGGSGRIRAWDALSADEWKLHSAAREREADPFPPVVLSDPATGRKLRRAEASVRLLRLTGAKAAGEAEALLRQALAAGRAADSEAAWEKFATRLRLAWLDELPNVVKAGGPAAERVARMVPPAAVRHRAWATLPAPLPADSLAAYREWAEGTPHWSDAKDSR